MPESTPLTGSKRPLLAALLQLCIFVGGLGYFYLGQHRKGAVVLLFVGALWGVDALAAAKDVAPAAMAIGVAILSLQALTALDAWQLAQLRRSGESIGPGDTLVPVLAPLLRR